MEDLVDIHTTNTIESSEFKGDPIIGNASENYYLSNLVCCMHLHSEHLDNSMETRVEALEKVVQGLQKYSRELERKLQYYRNKWNIWIINSIRLQIPRGTILSLNYLQLICKVKATFQNMLLATTKIAPSDNLASASKDALRINWCGSRLTSKWWRYFCCRSKYISAQHCSDPSKPSDLRSSVLFKKGECPLYKISLLS